MFLQGKTDEVCPQRLSQKRVKPQANGGRKVCPLTGKAEGGEIVYSHMKV